MASLSFFSGEKLILSEAEFISPEMQGLAELFEQVDGSTFTFRPVHKKELSFDESYWAITISYYGEKDDSYYAIMVLYDCIYLDQNNDGTFEVNYDYVIDLNPIRVLIQDPNGLGLNRQYKKTNKIKIVDNLFYGFDIWNGKNYYAITSFRGTDLTKLELEKLYRPFYGNLADIFSIENLRKFIPESIPISYKDW